MGICKHCGEGIKDSEEEAGVCPNCFYGIEVNDEWRHYDYDELDNNELLRKSAKNGNLAKVKECIANGADVNAENYNGWTALMKASNGHFEIVKILVENGAGVNAENYNGWTALMEASQNGHFDIVKYLIANGADVNAKNEWGETALDYAKTDEIRAYLAQAIKQKEFIDFAKQCDLENIRECLSSGININMVDSDGKTALMLACQKGYLDLVLILIAGGANVNAKDKNGKTVLNYAAESGNVELIKLLLAQGADTGAKK